MQLVILCGGKATRLGQIAKDTPKALTDINGKPFLEILMEDFRKLGFSKFVLLTGHLGEQFEKYKAKDVEIVREKKPLGTGGAILNAIGKLDSHFYVVNADTQISADLKLFIKNSWRMNSALILHDKFAGLFAFNKDNLIGLEVKNLNLEKDIMPNMKMYWHVAMGHFHDIGTPTSLEAFRKARLKMAVFIDRDGTLIRHIPYLKDPTKVELKKDIVGLAKTYQREGYKIILISNQSGINKGHFNMGDFLRVDSRMDALLREEGLVLDDKFVCFSSDDDNPYRKPNIGMISQAVEKHGLTLSECVFIGDQEDVDMECARRAGIKKTHLVR